MGQGALSSILDASIQLGVHIQFLCSIVFSRSFGSLLLLGLWDEVTKNKPFLLAVYILLGEECQEGG